MKNLNKLLQVCIVCMLLLTTLSKVNGQTPGSKMDFSFIDRKPVVDVRSSLNNILRQKPKAVQKINNVALSAVPLTDEALNILPKLIGKKVDAVFLVTNNLTADRVIGLTYSAQIISQYIELEKEYNRRLLSSKPEQRKILAVQWNAITEEAINQFKRGGLTVTQEELAKWSMQLRQSGLNNTVNRVLSSAVSINATPASPLSPATGSVGVSRITEWLLLSNPVNTLGLISDTLKMAADFCSKPIANGSFQRDWNASYNYNASIPYWCPTWSNPGRICHKTVTLFTFSIDLGINIGYSLTCCGGSCWATGSFQACAGILGANACLNCSAGGSAVIGVGTSSSGGNCTYGIGINVSVNCTLLGFTIIEANYPIWGYTVTGPCPPAGFHCK